jgi:hypothetical protein
MLSCAHARRQLVALGADLEAGDPEIFGRTSLHLAAYHGQTETVQVLVELGAHLNSSSVPLRWTALHYAAQRGQNETVKVLMQLGADPMAVNDFGKTPCKLARLNGHGWLATWIANHTREGEETLETISHSLKQMGLSQRNSTLQVPSRDVSLFFFGFNGHQCSLTRSNVAASVQAAAELEKERKLRQALGSSSSTWHPGAVFETAGEGDEAEEPPGQAAAAAREAPFAPAASLATASRASGAGNVGAAMSPTCQAHGTSQALTQPAELAREAQPVLQPSQPRPAPASQSRSRGSSSRPPRPFDPPPPHLMHGKTTNLTAGRRLAPSPPPFPTPPVTQTPQPATTSSSAPALGAEHATPGTPHQPCPPPQASVQTSAVASELTEAAASRNPCTPTAQLPPTWPWPRLPVEHARGQGSAGQAAIAGIAAAGGQGGQGAQGGSAALEASSAAGQCGATPAPAPAPSQGALPLSASSPPQPQPPLPALPPHPPRPPQPPQPPLPSTAEASTQAPVVPFPPPPSPAPASRPCPTLSEEVANTAPLPAMPTAPPTSTPATPPMPPMPQAPSPLQPPPLPPLPHFKQHLHLEQGRLDTSRQPLPQSTVAQVRGDLSCLARGDLLLVERTCACACMQHARTFVRTRHAHACTHVNTHMHTGLAHASVAAPVGARITQYCGIVADQSLRRLLP